MSVIQYADVMIYSLESARNLKIILCIFEQLTRLEIKFQKSVVSFFRAAIDKHDMYIHIFITCKKGDLCHVLDRGQRK